jgi:hypothetical protein
LDSLVLVSVSVAVHAKADSSTFGFLVTGSSSDKGSETFMKGDWASHLSPALVPRLAAIAVSESWLLIVAINDPNAASILSASSSREEASWAQIFEYTVGLDIFPFLYSSTRALHLTSTS